MRNRVLGTKVKATREPPQGSLRSPRLPWGRPASEVSPGSEARVLCSPVPGAAVQKVEEELPGQTASSIRRLQIRTKL